MPGAATSDFATFKEEIVQRFFHPKSFFFLCLSTHLQDTSSIATDITEEDYLIIGQLMQSLVEAPSASTFLEELSRLERFADFSHHLNEGLRHLRENALTPEDIKHTIEGLANDFVESLIDVIHSADENARLREILGLASDKESHMDTDIAPASAHDLQQESPELTELNETILENLSFEPESPAEREPSLPIEVEKAPIFPEQLPNEDGEIDEAPVASERLDDVLDLLDDTEPEEDSGAMKIAPEAGVLDAEHRDENLRPPHAASAADKFEAVTRAGADEPAAPDGQRERAGVEASGVTSPQEPDGLKMAFYREAENILAGLSEQVAHLPAGKYDPVALKKLGQTFLNLRESSMIHGFEAMEEIAQKLQKLTKVLLATQQQVTRDLLALFRSCLQALEWALQDTIDSTTAQELQHVVQQINLATTAPRLYRGEHQPQADLEKISLQFNDAADAPAPQDAPEVEAGAVSPQMSMEPASENEPVEDRRREDAGNREAHDSTAVMPDTEHMEAEKEVLDLSIEMDVQQEAEDLFQLSDSASTDRREDSQPAATEKHADGNPGMAQETELSGEADRNDELQEDADLHLPGEEDADLLKLIKEISENNTAGNKKASGDAPDQTASRGPAAGLKLKTAVPAHTTDERLLQFREEAELYFGVIGEALDTLRENPRDRLALENVELAAQSLKLFAAKIGLDALARFPELAEEYVARVIIAHKACSQEALNSIEHGFAELKVMADVKNINQPRFRELEKNMVKLVKALAANADKAEPDQPSEARPDASAPQASAENDAASLQVKKFRLRGRAAVQRQAIPGTPANTPPGSKKSQNLDYLMNRNSESRN